MILFIIGWVFCTIELTYQIGVRMIGTKKSGGISTTDLTISFLMAIVVGIVWPVFAILRLLKTINNIMEITE